MTTFDSTKASLNELLKEIEIGKIQLPEFQRGWVWDDDHIRDLLISLARSFPIGAIMLLEAGGKVRFETRPVEGLENVVAADYSPEKLILDGQQRLTTLTQALSLEKPVQTRTSKRKSIQRFYYFDIVKCLDNPLMLEDALIAVDQHRLLRGNFGRDILLDLSTTELECKELCFPCNQIMSSDSWEMKLHEVAPNNFPIYMDFRKQILASFRNYQLPVIFLTKETSKEAVCIVFEKVNTGGVQLSVFELITASWAADGYSLRDDWYGSVVRGVESRKERLEREPLLKGTEATEFLQAISLLHTYEQRKSDPDAGKEGKQVRPVSAKRADVLQLPLSAWKQWANKLEQGWCQVAHFLRKECFYNRRELPYSTQLVPLAAVLTRLGDRWLEPRIYDKLARWYWCGVLGELYGGAVETRMANDCEDVLRWIEDDEAVPRTVRDANFQPDRFDTLQSRRSAAYKAINILVIREGSKDWFWKSTIRDLDAYEVAIDIHHIFPKKWCVDSGIAKDRYNCILNKTPISYKANRTIGGIKPSEYLPRIQNKPQVSLSDTEMDELLESHALSSKTLRHDEFDLFIEDRRKRLSKLIERAMGKPVTQSSEE